MRKLPQTLLASIVIIGGLFCSGQAAPAQPTAPDSQFEQIGHFQNGNTFHGLVFFVNAPTKQNIEKLCQQKKVLFSSAALLKIHFFDNRQFTPDVTAEYYFPETSDAYLVADCFFNTGNGEEGLNFHKDIPD